jgi:ATP-dependent helicase Lhr and Lhr-like helicase
MKSFELLSTPIKKYIYDKGWGSLRPIQEEAIKQIIQNDKNYVLISRTASGKTEAAFLPILSKVNFKQKGVKVLYISPLIALINDQFERVEKLCEYLDVPVTKWHGEASKGQKDKLIQNPEGIVLITPESIEAMFVNKPYNVKNLFSELEYVVIDEIHSFLGSDRGIHLQSLLSRLQKINHKKFNIVGLSATVSRENNFIELKDFLGGSSNTSILLDSKPKPINAIFKYFAGGYQELPLDLLKDLYIRTRDSKVLIFPNARGRVEEVAVKLKKISDKVGGHKNYFSHHSSVDREVREYVENFAKSTTNQSFCISCTSTLELGIDIGNVDEVVQIDATNSIASLIQRVGRSGRREGKASNLFLYATDKWSLLQSVACWLLHEESYIEPISVKKKPYDVLVHQILSIVKGNSGILPSQLLQEIINNAAFCNIETVEIEEITNYLVAIDFLEKIGQELIIGVEGEKVVNNKDFYSLFKTETFLRVINRGINIGELPLTPQIQIDENVFLSAKIWKIIDVDLKSKKIEVMPANDGKKPLFFGNASDTAHKIRQKMFEILFTDKQYDFLDKTNLEILKEQRKYFSVFEVNNINIDRPLKSDNNTFTFYSFAGSKINKSLHFILKTMGIESVLIDDESSFRMAENDKQRFISALENLNTIDFSPALMELLRESPAVLEFSKWAAYLPSKYQIEILKENYFDFEGCNNFLQNLNFIEN